MNDIREPFRSLRARGDFCLAIQEAADQHKRWVDRGGLRSGEVGPLDELIDDLDECLELAKKVRVAEEEGDE